MPVPAAAWNRLYVLTVIAGIKNGSEGTASAVTDILNGFYMDFGHPVSIEFQILFAVNLEYFLNGAHDNTPCIN
jgi:hypothetical protein